MPCNVGKSRKIETKTNHTGIPNTCPNNKGEILTYEVFL